MVGGRRFSALLLVGVSLVGACGGDDGPEPERATVPTAESTTTTIPATTTTSETTAPPADFEALPADPALTPEQQVEAAYLHSWDIYLDAVGNGRTEHLPLAYAETALEGTIEEVNELIAEGRRIEGAPEHAYEISIGSDGQIAVVFDRYVNHLVYVDASSGEPLEDDPNEVVAYSFTMVLQEGVWYVAGVDQH